MSDLTTPAANAIMLPTSSAQLPASVPNSSGKGGFSSIMNDREPRAGEKSRSAGPVRQDDAASGKDLPEKDEQVDPALAWLFGPTMMAPAAAPLPAPAIASTDFGGALKATPEGAPNVLIALEIPQTEPDVEVQAKLGVNIGRVPVPPLPFATPARETGAVHQAIKLPLLQFSFLPDRAVNAQPVTAALPVLSAQAITAEISRGDDDDPRSALTVQTPMLSQPTSDASAAPLGDAQRQMLDFGRSDWPQKMIDHIEALRDNANANDTSIRLRPEALGRVDIALRTHDGGAISVRFTAEQPVTHGLLVDATPQLAAAAVARGIRLSGTSVDLAGQGDQRPHQQGRHARPIINHLADTQGDDNGAVWHGRIA